MRYGNILIALIGAAAVFGAALPAAAQTVPNPTGLTEAEIAPCRDLLAQRLVAYGDRFDLSDLDFALSIAPFSSGSDRSYLNTFLASWPKSVAEAQADLAADQAAGRSTVQAQVLLTYRSRFLCLLKVRDAQLKAGRAPKLASYGVGGRPVTQPVRSPATAAAGVAPPCARAPDYANGGFSMLSYPIAADEIKCSTARWGFDFPYEKLVGATAEDWRAAAKLDERHDLIAQSAAQEGDIVALYLTALAAENGWYAPAKSVDALRAYRELYGRGFVHALYDAARLTADGKGTQANPREASVMAAMTEQWGAIPGREDLLDRTGRLPPMTHFECAVYVDWANRGSQFGALNAAYCVFMGLSGFADQEPKARPLAQKAADGPDPRLAMRARDILTEMTRMGF